ncbi:MAG: hypothetical protein H6595_13435 [Flavobacteriales bacterium]|nr:hypothetical protein [Flavobacteriales bacterium]MCB9168469.1 hypothetical protein [Flavobacteriales bacterium]
MKHVKLVLACVLFGGLNIFLSLNYHSHSHWYTYHDILWADRAGYFAYLPSKWGTQGALSSELGPRTGHGFHIDESGRMVTKYTCGVALLIAPFYYTGHAIGSLLGHGNDPYGPVDHLVVPVSAGILATLALLLLGIMLRHRWSMPATILALVLVFLGSNLFYYTIGDPGMSHVYSFFLFVCTLFLLDRRMRNGPSIAFDILLGIVMGTILLIRPTNAVFLLGSIWLARSGQLKAQESDTARTTGFAQSRMWPILLAATLPLLLQAFYWQRTFGTPVHWSYTDESFMNWAHPRIFRVLFSTNNGAFAWSPLFAFVPLAALHVLKKGQKWWALMSIFLFVAVVYMSGSWWVWHFGCGFGCRNLVEYLAVFAFPLTGSIDRLIRRFGWWPVIAVVCLIVAYEFKLVYSYDGCWHGGEWDQSEFLQLLFGPTK